MKLLVEGVISLALVAVAVFAAMESPFAEIWLS